jgi:hypothetical protein
LVGLLFLNPLAGMAVGAAVGAGAGALSGSLMDYGIDDNFIRELSDTLKPDTSAIFVLVRKVQAEKVLSELSDVRGRVLRRAEHPATQARLLRLAVVYGVLPADDAERAGRLLEACADAGVGRVAGTITALEAAWVVPLVHGFFRQVTLSQLGCAVRLTLSPSPAPPAGNRTASATAPVEVSGQTQRGFNTSIVPTAPRISTTRGANPRMAAMMRCPGPLVITSAARWRIVASKMAQGTDRSVKRPTIRLIALALSAVTLSIFSDPMARERLGQRLASSHQTWGATTRMNTKPAR